MAKLTLDDITASYASIAQINSNFQDIEDIINDNILFRDNPDGEPNELLSDIDVNSKRLYNLPIALQAYEAVPLVQVQTLIQGIGTNTIVGRTLETTVASASQTVVTFGSLTYTIGNGGLHVTINGLWQIPGDSYTETSTTSITFSEGLKAGDKVTAWIYTPV